MNCLFVAHFDLNRDFLHNILLVLRMYQDTKIYIRQFSFTLSRVVQLTTATRRHGEELHFRESIRRIFRINLLYQKSKYR